MRLYFSAPTSSIPFCVHLGDALNRAKIQAKSNAINGGRIDPAQLFDVVTQDEKGSRAPPCLDLGFESIWGACCDAIASNAIGRCQARQPIQLGTRLFRTDRLPPFEPFDILRLEWVTSPTEIFRKLTEEAITQTNRVQAIKSGVAMGAFSRARLLTQPNARRLERWTTTR